ncbi:MAG: hypothetical protein AAB608_00790 [Patescibacteria group bacterium]
MKLSRPLFVILTSIIGALAITTPAHAECVLTSASWSQSGSVPGTGQPVNMQVFGNGCTGTVIYIDVYSSTRKVNTEYTAMFPSSGRASTEAPFALSDAIWNQLGGGQSPALSLYFKVRVGNQSATIQSPALSFQKPFPAATPTPSSTVSPPPTVTTDKTLGGMIAQVYEWAILLLGAIMFFMLLKSGFTILTSGDNPSAVTKARSDIQDVFVGALLLLAAYAILNTINPDLVNFQQNLPPLPTPKS